MPKTIKNVFDEKLTFLKLLEANERAAKNKRLRDDVIIFYMDLETNIMNLYRQIKNDTYKHGDYNIFVVKEPKTRIIMSLPYKDRIVHQWYVEEFVIPYYMPRFIKDTYACIKDRGTHKAVETLQKYMRIMKRKYGHYYIIKFDIKKYFFNIDRDILFEILKKDIKDKKLLHFTEKLIFDTDDKKGIPIGNYTSQYFANIYLNELDHFVKEKLRIKYYLRYMDDFIILIDTKEKAKEIKRIINDFLNEKLDLELNKKSRYYPNELGVDFCGYRVYETHILLRKRSKKKIRKLVKEGNYGYRNNCLDFESFRQKFNSWRGHARHANSYKLRQKYHGMLDVKDKLEI